MSFFLAVSRKNNNFVALLIQSIRMDKLVGRERETAELMRCYQSERPEFVILYGRRRIGKTFLVNQTFKGRFTFQFTGSHQSPKERQLEMFANALKEYGGMDFQPVVDNWHHAFDALRELLRKKRTRGKKVVFFDEMPWIDTYGSEFVAALEDFWNTWASQQDDICFLACGSATSWMVDKLVENQGGLHGRITSRIYLRPFNLNETEQYLRTHGCLWNRYTITQCYMYLGGVPYYLSLLDCKKELVENIDDLFFNTSARLSGEFHELFNVLFKDADRYVEIARLLAGHREGLTRQELAKSTQSGGGTLSKRIENLERCDFITGQQQVGNRKKGTIYRLTDFYTLFYFRFIDGVKRRDRPYWPLKADSREVMTWQGITFELIAMTHVEQIIGRLGIAGVLTNVCSWRSKGGEEGAQIDLLIERQDQYIYLCEAKFSVEPYIVSKDYEQRLRRRMAIFREETNTRKALLTTFITTFGVKPGIHAGVVQREVVMDDLFKPV